MNEIKRRYKQMTDEDKKFSKIIDFEQMMNEINQSIQQFVDMVHFKEVNDEQIAIIDATMTTIHDATSTGELLLEEMKVVEK